MHASASRAEETEWPRIATLYQELTRLSDSPVIELNRAVAVAMAEGPARGLEIVEGIHSSGELERYSHLHATRADVLRRLGRFSDAANAYRRAVELTGNRTEREFLERRLSEVATRVASEEGSAGRR